MLGFNGTKRGAGRARLLVWAIVIVLLLAACGGSEEKGGKSEKITVGILSHSPSLGTVVDGFKAGMAELGYVEGEDITYIFNGPTGGIDGLEPELDVLVSKKIDLLLTTGTPPTSVAKQKLEGKNIPVVFAPVNDPVGDGLIESMSAPGGFITGIKNSDSIGKSLDWLVQIVPDVKRVYVPHNPNDQSSVSSVEDLQATANNLGIELVIEEADTPDKIAVLATDFPEDVDAIFIVRSGSISAKIADFVQTANALGIPVFTSTSGEYVEAGVLLGFGSSYYSSGKQAARLANQILRGASPATLPAEVAEAFLGINMKSAEAIGVEIPDTVMRQASQIIRD